MTYRKSATYVAFARHSRIATRGRSAEATAAATGLPEAVGPAALPPGTKEERNDWERTGYGGPAPHRGRHRYFHRLYALDTVLSLGQATKT